MVLPIVSAQADATRTQSARGRAPLGPSSAHPPQRHPPWPSFLLSMANATTAISPLEAAAITLQLFNVNRAGINAALAQRYMTGMFIQLCLCPQLFTVCNTGLGFALLVYDHIITFQREIELVWRARASPSKFLFLLNRYIVPCAMIPVLWGEFVQPSPLIPPADRTAKRRAVSSGTCLPTGHVSRSAS
jgi:hypothetical protein